MHFCIFCAPRFPLDLVCTTRILNAHERSLVCTTNVSVWCKTTFEIDFCHRFLSYNYKNILNILEYLEYEIFNMRYFLYINPVEK